MFWKKEKKVEDRYQGKKYIPIKELLPYNIPIKEVRVSALNSEGMYDIDPQIWYIPQFKIEEFLKDNSIKEVQ